MAFTGKATYSAGAELPELAEDVSDIIGIVSPHETALLDHLGDPRRVARSTMHEWLEDELLPNKGQINQASFSPNATSATSITVDDGSVFQAGDQVRPETSGEILLVTAVAGNVLTVTRGYGGTTAEALEDDQELFVIGNAALEGADAATARFTNRVRRTNWTQIFAATVEVSGSQLAADSIGIEDELDYQKQERMRELLRDLENCVINGVAPAANPQGSSTVRRTMKGILAHVQTNRMSPGEDGIPIGSGFNEDELSEAVLNAAMRRIWESSSGTIDTIVVNGSQKRKINAFIGENRAYSPAETNFRNLVSTYSSDFGVARVVLSRWMPADSALLLDSSRVSVLPLAGRSFQFKRLASSGDREAGQVIGEYTLELRNENAHGLITGLGTD